MVCPTPIQNRRCKLGFVVLLLTQVEDEILVWVTVVKHSNDVVDVVAIHPLDPRCWETHRDDSFRDVRKVQIHAIISEGCQCKSGGAGGTTSLESDSVERGKEETGMEGEI